MKMKMNLGNKAGGAPKWMAPERFADCKPFKDIYSYGLVVWEIATNGMKLYSNIKNEVDLLKVKARDDIYDLVVILKLKDTASLLKLVVKQCCKFDPCNRISLEKLVFELLNKFQNLVWNDCGRSFLSEGKIKEALAAYTQSLVIEPKDTSTLIGHGETLILMDRHEDSLTDLNQLLEIKQDDANILNIRGKLHCMMNNYEESLVDLNKSLEINLNNADALRNRGITYYRMRNYNESLSDLNKSLNIEPNNSIALKWRK
ncbi:hypothetical protein C2G38_2319729 [Gigaspora rosea]|uniref:Protein kinase domain-containing protein n=1 Tax=Gigaspora rosea TaxID=44941 RepID=A0A397W081_9GLOM|nr:hypothetical protein C2G38_2319729 [Gigaspora rosea]